MPASIVKRRRSAGVRLVLASALAFLLAAPPVPGAAPAPAAEPEGASGWTGKPVVYARHELVVAANPLAADAGLELLHAGGSAVDAALATQLVLGLVEPQSSGIGGGAFMLVWSQRERRLQSYDGRETAPAAARPGRFLDAEGRPLKFFDAAVSGLSVGVPGVLRMFELAHAQHGRLPWARAFAPAIRLAERGFPMSPRLHRLLERDPYLRRDPAAKRLYYRRDGHARPVGARIVNRAYAAVLRRIAARGARAFYTGALAADIVRAVRAQPRPGDMSRDDLAGYRALERTPVCGAYRGRRICGMGPPSSGGITLLEMLGILQRTDFARAPAGSAEAVHLFTEAARLAYADRARYIADPAFYPVPVAGLLEPSYLAARARLIGERSMGVAQAGTPRGARPAPAAPEAPGRNTSHLSIVDAAGNAVALTTSIENAFGSRIMVHGFLLNNQLTDFTFEPRSGGLWAANRVQARKRPRSSMAPTFVFSGDGSLQLIVGSPGGPFIIDFVAKTLVATIDWGLDIQSAVSLPNFGSLNGPTVIEAGSSYERLIAPLVRRGHAIATRPLTSGLHGIERVAPGSARLPEGGWRSGIDPRREGAARGD